MLYLSCLVDVSGPIVKWFKIAGPNPAGVGSNPTGATNMGIETARKNISRGLNQHKMAYDYTWVLI